MEQLPNPLPPERIGEVYANIMRLKAAQYARVRFGDKTPSNSGHLPRIFRDFPDAKVVHIVRDPRGTALSLSRMPWASSSVRVNTVLCELERRNVGKYEGRVLRIRLEDLLGSPKETMAKVLDYVGEPWDDAVLDHAKNVPDKHDMPPLPWLESSAQDRGAPSAQWSSMTPLQIRSVEKLGRRLMEQGGYAPAELAHEPSRGALLWNAVRDTPETLRYFALYGLLIYRMRDPRVFYTKEGTDLFRRVNPKAWSRYPGFELPEPPPLPSG